MAVEAVLMVVLAISVFSQLVAFFLARPTPRAQEVSMLGGRQVSIQTNARQPHVREAG